MTEDESNAQAAVRREDNMHSPRRIHHSAASLWLFRSCWIVAAAFTMLQRDVVQDWVEWSWRYLYSHWLFNSVYFETWWTTFVYTIYLLFARAVTGMRYFDKYKLNSKSKGIEIAAFERMLDAIGYCTPLMLLDTFVVKKYKGLGIEPDLWIEKRRSIVQVTRTLPHDPPRIEAIVGHLILSISIYDAVFYVIHYTIHRDGRLYKWIHATHHKHGELDIRITNLLSLPERVVLVLSANEALKLVYAHPLTRMLFVPVFVGLLCENHCGYDFPWSYDKLFPPGFAGGSYIHYKHHMNGDRHYQPFLTYLDKLFTNGKHKKKLK